MGNMKMLLLALLFASALFSAYPTQYIDVVGSKETGTGNSIWPEIRYNCSQKTFHSTLYGGPDPLANANAYLFYLDYSYQLIATDKSDANGSADFGIVGKDTLLKKVFVLRVEKTGYKTLEVQFAINCSKTYPVQPPAQNIQNVSNSSTNNTINITANSTAANNSQAGSNSANNTNGTQSLFPPAENLSNPVNDFKNSTGNQGASGGLVCAPAFALLPLGALLFRLRKYKDL
ncbi:Uncharacterised protein [uncultured archaeon]|nr:Uncharacterised protein [uncultured archaeon]